MPGGHDARKGRDDGGVARQGSRLADAGARSACGCLGSAKFGSGAIECGLADEFLLEKLLLAFVIGAGVRQIGGGLGNLCLAAGHGGPQFLCREANDDRARLDVVTRVEIHG